MKNEKTVSPLNDSPLEIIIPKGTRITWQNSDTDKVYEGELCHDVKAKITDDIQVRNIFFGRN